jgi:cbb3-type cytochrome oxidase maturation protein
VNNVVIAMMLGVSIILAAVALLALLWGLRSGQFDERDKFLDTVHKDGEDELNDAYVMQKRKEEAKKRDKEKNYRPPD